MDFLDEVIEELERANSMYPLFNSPHEGYAVILEELEEMWAEIKANDPIRTREEAIHVAAMALKFILSMDMKE